MFDANACAVQLLKMKNSEELKKDGTDDVTPHQSPPISMSTEPTATSQVPLPPPPSSSSSIKAADLEKVGGKASGMTATENSLKIGKENHSMEAVSPLGSAELNLNLRTDPHKAPTARKPCDKADNKLISSADLPPPSTTVPKPPQETSMPSTCTNLSSSSPSFKTNRNTNLKHSNIGSASFRNTNYEEAMSTDSSSEEEEDGVYLNSFPKDNMGSDSNEPAEELIIKRNNEYLLQRCSSLMHRLQGIMQSTAARHVSKQLQAVMEHPGLNPALKPHPPHGRSSLHSASSTAFNPPPLTKQGIEEVQFTSKLMSKIIRHSMSHRLDPNDDSATEESDTDDEEVVLPDERLMEPALGMVSAVKKAVPYLPVENNPFIEAIKLEKQFEARQTSLEYSIVECEYSLAKSIHLRRHCKARKPVFQLEKPTVSSNIINIPVDPTSSVKFYHDSKPTTIKRVSDMMPRRSSLEQERVKINGNGGAGGSNNLKDEQVSKSAATNVQGTNTAISKTKTTKTPQKPESLGESKSTETDDFIPTIQTLGTEGVSMLGVEFVNSSDPNQSSSRCSAIKRPDKNRKVFQLGGIQNIFRDSYRLPTVQCTCFGRDELCALCLGRAKRKTEVNHVHMNMKDKLAILDETFHKSLSISEDIPLEVLLTSSSVGNTQLVPPTSDIQKLIKARSEQFPPDFLETGPRPKKPRVYDIKPYVEQTTARSPKKERYGEGDERLHQPRKKQPPRKSQSSFDDKDLNDYAGKGFGWPSRERKDSTRRTRNQEFDIDNIVIPYSMAASARVEQLVYKPIETPRWRVMDYSEIFPTTTPSDKEENDKIDDGDKLEDMSNAAFLDRHNKCEIEEKKKFTVSLQKALNATRKTRRLDSTGRSESICESTGLTGLSSTGDRSAASTPPPVSPLPGVGQGIGKSKEKETNSNSGTGTAAGTTEETKETSTLVSETATVITEAMANQALKSLFKVGTGRRRTVSTTVKVEVEEEELQVVSKSVDPWPQRKFPLTEDDYRDMVDEMEKACPDYPVGITSHSSGFDDDPLSPKCS